MRRLVEKYEKLLDGDSGPDALGVLEAEERREQLREQGIRPNTLTERAGEAIERTRERYVKSFVSDGLTQGEAEARAISFISDPDRCVPEIWKNERARIDQREEVIDKGFKSGAILVQALVVAPLVFLFFSTLPAKESVEMAKFYLTNNCNAIGGIKCNGEGAQGQKLPNIMKALTPPKNGGKIVREKVNPVTRGGISAEEE